MTGAAAFAATGMVVFLVEITDKTRIIALLLSARFRAPYQLLIGMTLGYVVPIAVAVWASEGIARLVPAGTLRYLTAGSFLLCGWWLLANGPTAGEESRTQRWMNQWSHLGPLALGLVLITVTEFADKSQLATAAMAIKYQQPLPVFAGSLTAQAFLNILYVFAGHHVGRRLPAHLIERFAGYAFLAFGLLALVWRAP